MRQRGILDQIYIGNAGVKIRLTKKGINHVKTVGVRLLNEQISQLSGYSTQFAISQPGIEGFVNLNNVRVLQFNPPQVSVVNFLPPRYVVLGLENMDIWLNGAFYGNGGPLQVEGFVDGSIIGMTVALTTEFSSTDEGLMSVQVMNAVEKYKNTVHTCTVGCKLLYNNKQKSFQHQSSRTYGSAGENAGGSSFLFHDTSIIYLTLNFYGLINEGIRHRIPGMFCKKLKHLIEDNSPRLFKKLVRTEFEEHFQEFGLIDSPVIKK
ncbi:unnamed protein product [Strongylus vulgaris]|uniref:Lipid-binding serum glycoprotein N-terminal domain-containing protein n=1 Tax=Strongylus vulgaris TaxID=40348 RepID=A0A3P7JQ87_STRVU|nr:unnamed protein product [Strongylus vulgaris]